MKEVVKLCTLFLIFGSGLCKLVEFDSVLREEWSAWKVVHGKEYGSLKEETERSYVWLDNKRFIDEHNCEADIHGYTLRMNHFGDMVSLVLQFLAFKMGLAIKSSFRKLNNLRANFLFVFA